MRGKKAIRLSGWGGIRYVPVEVIGETPKRYRVRLVELSKLAGRQRWGNAGDVILVPKYAVVDIAEERNA